MSAAQDSAHEGTCRSCGGAVILAINARGSYVPLDAEPSRWGTIEIRHGQARTVPEDELEEFGKEHDLHLPHVLSCPSAAEVRKRVAPAQSVASERDQGSSDGLAGDTIQQQTSTERPGEV